MPTPTNPLHTPTPWRVDSVSTFGAYGIWTEAATHPGHDGAGYPTQICSMFSACFKQTDKATRAERDANAALIVRAVNLHEMMLAALKLALPELVNEEAANAVRAAIAAAEPTAVKEG